ncbi:c-type cytochrome [Leptothoe kymatousa]|uniref:C-type cytochrome n=1 Tax=Leptothoe kymatousa TAU-MAC 1615 TaxID=2364775 RepID=A0ABS5Y6J0_9CYAN|nr:c-type cytochrome [Leptothoe kymatousa]MBT9312580.1 c-type cytochrome [Leptothoe kymatousa TAU-MAC 1615]
MRLLLPMVKGLIVSFFLVSFWLFVPSAWADQGSSSAALFDVHCAGCHPNGANIIRRGKSLKQRALKRHGYGSAEAIATLITNGKGLMSAYGDQLTEQEIRSLANYVVEQAEIDWRGDQ